MKALSAFGLVYCFSLPLKIGYNNISPINFHTKSTVIDYLQSLGITHDCRQLISEVQINQWFYRINTEHQRLRYFESN